MVGWLVSAAQSSFAHECSLDQGASNFTALNVKFLNWFLIFSVIFPIIIVFFIAFFCYYIFIKNLKHFSLMYFLIFHA